MKKALFLYGFGILIFTTSTATWAFSYYHAKNIPACNTTTKLAKTVQLQYTTGYRALHNNSNIVYPNQISLYDILISKPGKA